MLRGMAILTFLFVLHAAGSLAQAGDRYRDRRILRDNVAVFVATPYGGGYFVKGYPDHRRYYERDYYYDRDYYRRERKYLQKRYHKKLKHYRRGYLDYHDHDGRCRHRYYD